MENFYKLAFHLTWKQKFKKWRKREPIETARKYCRRIYLSLDFIDILGLDVRTLNVKAIYTSTSVAPVLLVDDKTSINSYIAMGTTEQSEKEARESGMEIEALAPDLLLIGYKHFDKWKFADGAQIGDFRSALNCNPSKAVRLQRMIQRQVLGFWDYWKLRLQKKI